MKGRTVALAAVAVVAVVALVVLFAQAPTDPDRDSSNPLDGRSAPAIDSTDTQGRAFKVSDYRGRWLLVNFFATWCVPCKIEHPELVAFSRAHSARADASVVSIAYDASEGADAIATFFRENGGDWPVITTATDQYSLAYGVVKLPESYLVDPDGIVVHKFVGGVTASGIDAEIAREARESASTTEPAGLTTTSSSTSTPSTTAAGAAS